MQRNRLAETLDTLKALERLELGLAGLYELCGGPAGSEPEFWTTLAQEERRHAEAIRRMAAIVAERPERFEPSRAFQLPAIRTFIAYLESLGERLRTGALSRTDQHRLLSIARDLEQSVLEGKWNEIVKTADAEFQALVHGVVAETVEHKARIAARLAAAPQRV